MAKKPKKTTAQNALPKNISHALLAHLSPEQLKQWRDDRLNDAIHKKGVNGKKVLRSYAKEHNEHIKEQKQAIAEGTRLTKRQLDKLTKGVASSLGLSAADLIDFTLSGSKHNKELLKTKTLSPAFLGLYLTNIAAAKSKFMGGISPQEVIRLSLPIDIERANRQIFMAQLFKRVGNTFYFVTNAGVHKQFANHKVTVQLVEYESLITGANKVPSQYTLTEFLKHKKVKFDCDCGRHGYWYRYLATIGKYNFGIDENRYPSTTNPNLRGVACKHTLRVIQHLQSGQGVQLLKKAIEQDLQKGYNVGSIRLDKKDIAQNAIIDSDPRRTNHHARQIKKKISTHLRAAYFAHEKDKQRAARDPNRMIANLKKLGLVVGKEQQDILKKHTKLLNNAIKQVKK